MFPLLSAAACREADQKAIQLGMSEAVLIEHAALSARRLLLDRFSTLLFEVPVLCLCGPGNNGGDSLALARLLLLDGNPNVYVFNLEGKRSPACQAQWDLYLKLGGKTVSALPAGGFSIVVDGIFGTGLSRPPEGPALQAVQWANAQKSWVLALDVPSGLNADTGMPLADEAVVKAAATITFGFYKKGLVTGVAANFVGDLHFSDIAIPRSCGPTTTDAGLFTGEDIQLPERAPASHKGHFGQVVVVAGQPEKEGASVLAAISSLRMGAGLCTMVGEKASLEAVRPRLPPEVMIQHWAADFLEKKAVVIGPGLGTEAPQWEQLKQALQHATNLVVDADAITLFATHAEEAKKLCVSRSRPAVLTPHPKEASRLLGTTVEAIQQDRYASAEKIAKQFGVICLLKGKGSVIASPHSSLKRVIDRGSPALAKGGSGDCLAGAIASLLAQGLAPLEATTAATYVHGRAAELWAQAHGETASALASEITAYFSCAIAELTR